MNQIRKDRMINLVLSFIVVFSTTFTSLEAQNKELEFNVFYGKSYFIFGGLPLNFMPFQTNYNAYTLAGNVDISIKPKGLPFRVKIGNQFVYKSYKSSKLMFNRVPINIAFTIGNPISVSLEAGIYGGALLYLDAPDNVSLNQTREIFQVGSHLKLGAAYKISPKNKVGISLHYYRDLSPIYHELIYSPGGGVGGIRIFGFDSLLSLDYSIRLD